MKKIITALFIFMLLPSSCFANSNSLNNNTYLNLMKDRFAEMNADIQTLPSGSLSFRDIDNSYLHPQITKLQATRDAIEGFIANNQDIEPLDYSLHLKHTEVMNDLNKIVALLNENIELKNELLESDYRPFKKFVKLFIIDELHSSRINFKIEKVNAMFAKMQESNN